MSDAAEQYRKLYNPGAYIGPFTNAITPYMVEPQDTLRSRLYTGTVFVGPAQSGKTDTLILNWITYGVVVDPMDMIVYCPTNSAARDFSMRRVDRLHRHSPDVGAMLLKTKDTDNKFDKTYRSGMLLNLSWPSVTEFAGRPVGRIAMTDFDRMPDDVEGDGNPYDLASKRTTTYGSFAMTLAESSPSRPVTDPKWIRSTPHEAPPTTGILALYNRGDRRRWYWPCPHCGGYFEGNFRQLEWDTRGAVMDSADTVRMICPSCGEKILPSHRAAMNEWGVWLADGQSIDGSGRIVGNRPRTLIASYWLNGVAAAFVTWPRLVATYLDAEAEFERTGSEEALKKFYNNDLGEAYISKALESERLPEVLKARGEDRDLGTVPQDVRFLIATVDVQKNMFVVQVFGVLPGEPFDLLLIDRFEIRKSQRLDEDGERLWVKPGTYLEDWDEITENVIKKSYPIEDGNGRRMQIKLVGCDSGGREGVTTNAYNYFRKLKRDGLGGRLHLLKGDPLPSRPRTQITYPDSGRKDKLSAARGDVPVMLMNSNLLKDALAHRLEAVVPGKGMLRYPKSLPDFWFAEMCAEARTDKGWTNLTQSRNEAWDLSYYAIALCVSALIRAESLDWEKPPGWAAPWAKNDLVTQPDGEERFAVKSTSGYDFAALGRAVA